MKHLRFELSIQIKPDMGLRKAFSLEILVSYFGHVAALVWASPIDCRQLLLFVIKLLKAANWKVRHTQFVTSRATRIYFQPYKVRLVGLCFNMIDPFVLFITQSGCPDICRKNFISLLQ